MSVFQRLYDSEINASVDWFWDCGFEVSLGDHLNGIKAEKNLASWAEVEEWLEEAARRHFPDSDFAKGEH